MYNMVTSILIDVFPNYGNSISFHNKSCPGNITLLLNEIYYNVYFPANFPPNVTFVDSIQVVVGQLFTLQLEASDPDGDEVTFGLLEMIEGASITPQGQYSLLVKPICPSCL